MPALRDDPVGRFVVGRFVVGLNVLVLALGVTLVACLPPQPLKPAPSGDLFIDACANMARLGDEEGAKPDCPELLEQIEAEGIVSMEPRCLAGAETRAELDACYADDVE